MFHILRIVFVVIVLSSCKGTNSLSNKTKVEVEVMADKYQILVQFKNPEGIKRTLYKLEQFQLELKTEVSESGFLYMLEIEAMPYEIDGIVEKMALDNDVDWAKKIVD